MLLLMPRPHSPVVVLTVLAWVFVYRPVPADPLPLSEHWMGGRLTPAEAVPVDMVEEKLVARLTRYQVPPDDAPAPAPYPARASVEITYLLRADEAISVPIVFPVTEEPESVVFALNGKPVRAKVVPDWAVYAAYEAEWLAAIETFIAADAVLTGLRDEARDLRDARPDDHVNPWTRWRRTGSSRLRERASRRLGELGIPDAETVAWALAHVLVDDWDLAATGPDALRLPTARQQELAATRYLALAFDPTLPDPRAIWAPAQTEMPGRREMERQMTFISATLPLHPGDNQFAVAYAQPVSFGKAACEAHTGVTGRECRHRQTGIFEFILRTARFWRSFGTLSATVHLPPGTVHAECSIPGATVSLTGAVPSVTCTATGVPDANLSVTFADCRVVPEPPVRIGLLEGGLIDEPATARPERHGTPPEDLPEVLASGGRRRPARADGGPQTATWWLIAGALVVVGGAAAFITARRRAAGEG